MAEWFIRSEMRPSIYASSLAVAEVVGVAPRSLSIRGTASALACCGLGISHLRSVDGPHRERHFTSALVASPSSRAQREHSIFYYIQKYTKPPARCPGCPITPLYACREIVSAHQLAVSSALPECFRLRASGRSTRRKLGVSLSHRSFKTHVERGGKVLGVARSVCRRNVVGGLVEVSF